MKRSIMITALFLLALSAFFLHLRIHPIFLRPQQVEKEFKSPSVEITTITQLGEPQFTLRNFIAGLFVFIDLALVTWLFCSKDTVAYAFLVNGMLVIAGTVLMAHFTFAELWGKGAGIMDWVYLKSTLPDIIILGADFLLGKSVYDSYAALPG